MSDADVERVLGIHSAVRWITGTVSGLALVLFAVQLYWDRKILTQMFLTCNMRRIAVHRSTRLCGAFNALLQVIASVDTLGVFGIYHVQFRIVLRLLSFVSIQPPLLFWVFFSAKPLFPFLFSNDSDMLRRLKYFLIGCGSLETILYVIFYYTTLPAFVIPSTMFALVFVSSLWVLNVAVHRRAKKILQTTARSAKGNTQLVGVIRSWVRQSIMQSILLLIPFGVYIQLLLQSVSHIPLGDARPDYLERNLTPNDALNARAVVGLATSICFVLFDWLYLYTSWRSRSLLEAEFDKSTSLKANKLSGSVSNASGAGNHCVVSSNFASTADTDVDSIAVKDHPADDNAYANFSDDDDLAFSHSSGGQSPLAFASRRNSVRDGMPFSSRRDSAVPLTSLTAKSRDSVVSLDIAPPPHGASATTVV